MKNKKAIAIVLAFFVSIIIVLIFKNSIKTAVNGNLVTVYTPKDKATVGDTLSYLQVEEKQIDKKYVPKNAITNLNSLKNKVAKETIFSYDIITQDKIVSAKNSYFNGKNDLVAITLNSQPAGLSGKLRRGDIVQIMGYKQSEMAQEDIELVEAPEELQEIEVVDIRTQNLKSTTDVKSKEGNTAPSELPSTVILKIDNSEQAKKIIEMEYDRKLHLVFIRRGK